MSIRISAKKVAIAAIMVAPLTLAACGSDDEDTTASSTTTQTSTMPSSSTKSAATTTTETTDETSEETSTVEVTTESTTEAPAETPPTPAAAPVEPVITYQELAPVEGQVANPEDAAAIESLIRGSLAPTTVRAMLQYVPQNTCNRVIDAAGGPAAMDFSTIPDLPLNQIPGASAGTIDSISDITVQGDTASAWVVASANGKTDSGTQRFLREDGRWKFCD